MAETTTPSVRGRLRLGVTAALAAGALSSAALAGLIVGVAGALLRAATDPGPTLVAAVIAVALVLDVGVLVLGRPRPFTLGRQVPREWGRLFDPRLVATLYGARLGVGPLTILSTWCWWAAMIGSSLVGVWTTVAVSMWFAATRVVLNHLSAVGTARDRGGHARRFGWLIAVGDRARLATTAMTLALVAAVVTTGCAAEARPALDQSAAPESDQSASDQSESDRSARPVLDQFARSAEPTSPNESTPPTALAYLEDVVRTSSTTATTSPVLVVPEEEKQQEQQELRSQPNPERDQTATPEALSASLPDALLGMDVVDDPAGNRFLTLTEAADIQPDPTEETALLETRGYAGGWIRAFRADTNDIVVTSVYQFADPTEAEFYLEDGLITIGGYGGQFFEVPGLPGVRGFEQSFTVEGDELTTLGGAFFHGSRWYLLYIVGTPQTAVPEVLIPAMAELQASAMA